MKELKIIKKMLDDIRDFQFKNGFDSVFDFLNEDLMELEKSLQQQPIIKFTDFVIKTHPDPDHLLSKKTDDAWDEICNLAEEYANNNYKGVNEIRKLFFSECTDMVDGLAKVNLTPHNLFEWFKPYLSIQFKGDEWISVEDRLPEYDKDVIVCRPNQFSGNKDILIAKLHRVNNAGTEYGRGNGMGGGSYAKTYNDYWSLPAIVLLETITHWRFANPPSQDTKDECVCQDPSNGFKGNSCPIHGEDDSFFEKGEKE